MSAAQLTYMGFCPSGEDDFQRLCFTLSPWQEIALERAIDWICALFCARRLEEENNGDLYVLYVEIDRQKFLMKADAYTESIWLESLDYKAFAVLLPWGEVFAQNPPDLAIETIGV